MPSKTKNRREKARQGYACSRDPSPCVIGKSAMGPCGTLARHWTKAGLKVPSNPGVEIRIAGRNKEVLRHMSARSHLHKKKCLHYVIGDEKVSLLGRILAPDTRADGLISAKLKHWSISNDCIEQPFITGLNSWEVARPGKSQHKAESHVSCPNCGNLRLPSLLCKESSC